MSYSKSWSLKPHLVVVDNKNKKSKLLLFSKYSCVVFLIILIVHVIFKFIYNEGVISTTSTSTKSAVTGFHQQNIPNFREMGKAVKLKPDQLSLLYSIFGYELETVLNSLSKLQPVDQSISDDMETLNQALLTFALSVTKKIGKSKNLSVMKDSGKLLQMAFSSKKVDKLIIKSAEYRVPSIGNIDIKFLLEPLIFNNVLRIPMDYPLKQLFGEGYFPPGESKIILIDAITSRGPESFEVKEIRGHLTEHLYISNARFIPEDPFDINAFENLLAKYIDSKKGIEIGGPSSLIYFDRIYQNATVDLINYSSKTIWGDFPDGSNSSVGRGVIRIMDGSYLNKLADNSYDFAMGCHYLEHLLNPLQALYAMRRVLKPNGVILLILPRKEACFDHLRSVSSIEEIFHRFLIEVKESEMKYANILEVTHLSNLTQDAPAKNFKFFRGRSLDNTRNRGIHQFVYDFELLQSMGNILGLKTLFTGVYGQLHMYILLQKTV